MRPSTGNGSFEIRNSSFGFGMSNQSQNNPLMPNKGMINNNGINSTPNPFNTSGFQTRAENNRNLKRDATN